LEVKQIRDAEASFSPSVFMAKELARIEAIFPRVIHTPLEIDFVQRDPSYYHDNLDGKNYLLFFGTLSRIKGVDLLALVIPKILSNFHDLAFVFVGRDDGLPDGQKVFDFLCEQCDEYADKLLYFPPQPKPKLYPIISNAIGVLMPSRVDNYPNVCLEAMSLGVPVIGTDESSLEEMIEDGHTGFLARNGDPESITEAILRLLDLSPEQRQQLKTNIIHEIDRISSDDRLNQLVSFYEEVIESFRR
jgi:glycosyltransferase involved in cell wall biosynthesis